MVKFIILFFLLTLCQKQTSKKHEILIPKSVTIINTPEKTAKDYQIIHSFENWKEDISIFSDTISFYENQFAGYSDSSKTGSSMIWKKIPKAFTITKNNEIHEEKIYSIKKIESYNLRDTISLEPKYDFIRKFYSKKTNYHSLINDQMNNRILVGYSENHIPSNSPNYDLIGVTIFEYNGTNWVKVYNHQAEDALLLEIKVNDFNKDGQNDIAFKYVSVGGSGFTTILDILSKN